jgi:hypothetical protein
MGRIWAESDALERASAASILAAAVTAGNCVSLILRSALARVSKDEAKSRASWFETREDALLTMRVGNYAPIGSAIGFKMSR